jgi:hypothetical protein
MMDYCNGVQGFINFTTSIPINFTGGGIRCSCRKCQNKKYLHPDVVMDCGGWIIVTGFRVLLISQHLFP